MSRAGVPHALSLVGLASLSLVSLMACSKTIQPIATTDQDVVEMLAPDVATIYVNFTCGADTTFGLFDAATNGKPVWAFMRHPTGTKNRISWEVAQNARPVAINAIGNKSGQPPFPIDVDANQQVGSPGVPFKATVKASAGAPGSIFPGTHRDTTYSYSIGVTCKPVTGPDVHIVIDPEMIVRRP